MTNEYRKTLCDIDVIINGLNEEERNKIHKKLRKLIQENKMENYHSTVRTDMPLENQELSETTKAFLAMLFINYWCKDQNEKKELIAQMYENEENYQKELSEKYSIEKIFSERKAEAEAKEKERNEEESNELVPHKESIIKKILNKIFSIFRRN